MNNDQWGAALASIHGLPLMLAELQLDTWVWVRTKSGGTFSGLVFETDDPRILVILESSTTNKFRARANGFLLYISVYDVEYFHTDIDPEE
jgi:hypothetical protein